MNAVVVAEHSASNCDFPIINMKWQHYALRRPQHSSTTSVFVGWMPLIRLKLEMVAKDFVPNFFTLIANCNFEFQKIFAIRDGCQGFCPTFLVASKCQGFCPKLLYSNSQLQLRILENICNQIEEMVAKDFVPLFQLLVSAKDFVPNFCTLIANLYLSPEHMQMT